MENQKKLQTIKSSGFEMHISPNLFLSDLIRIESFQDLSYESACIYLSQAVNGSKFKFSTSLTNLNKDEIILLPN